MTAGATTPQGVPAGLRPSGQLVKHAPLAHLRWGDSGPLVVLLHGVGGGREAWSDVVSGTGRQMAAAGFTVVAVDLPGYGDSEPIEPLTMAAMAQAVFHLLTWLKASSAILVGHSMGGMVAQQMLAQSLDGHADCKIAGLVISGSTPAFGKPDGAWQQQFLRERLEKLDAGKGMNALAPSLVRGMAAPGAAHANLARAAIIMAAVPEATYRQALRALIGFDQRALLPHITIPVLCVAGESDRNAPPAVMKQMADRIQGAVYVCLPGMGHLANMETPGVFNAAVIHFLKRTFS